VNVPPVDINTVEGQLKHRVTGGGPFEKYNADPGSAGYDPFVMSSARTDITIAGASITAPNPIRLYRDVAKINLKVDIDPATGEKFDLTEIILVNYNTETFAVPSPKLTAMWNDPDLTPAQRADRPLFASNVVRSGTNFIQPPENSIVYAGSGAEAEISEDQQTCIDEIFTFERLAWTNGRHLCLIIQGNVTIDGVRRTGRFYKLELRKANPQAGDELEYINILRNYAYDITITDVQNFGYDGETEAYANAPDGLVTNITATPEEGMNEFVYNGSYQLAVNRSLFEVSAAAAAYHDLKVFTDYQFGWRLDTIEYQNVNDTGWLLVTTSPMYPPDPEMAGTAVPNQPGTSTPVIFDLLTDNESADYAREAKLKLTAGSLYKYVTVRQSKAVAPSLDVDTGQLTLNSSDGSTGTVGVTSNTTWTAALSGANAADFTLSTAGGTGDGIVTVTANSDNGATPREATLTLTAGTLTRTVAITQSPAAVGTATITIEYIYYMTGASLGTEDRTVPAGSYNITPPATYNGRTFFSAHPSNSSPSGTIGAGESITIKFYYK
jgi:hypothetical protein